MFYDMKKLKTVEEARIVMARAKERGLDDIFQAALRRKCEIEAGDHPDPIIIEFWRAVSAVEEVLYEKHGRNVKANYTRRKAKKDGEIACLQDWALKKRETEGFRMLIDWGLGDHTGEYVVYQNADRFPANVVTAAKNRLIEHRVLAAC